MADDRLEYALDVVARRLVCSSVDNALDGGEWENFPEIGESDWEGIEERALRLVDELRPRPDDYEAGYEYLQHRAEQWEKEHRGEVNP